MDRGWVSEADAVAEAAAAAGHSAPIAACCRAAGVGEGTVLLAINGVPTHTLSFAHTASHNAWDFTVEVICML